MIKHQSVGFLALNFKKIVLENLSELYFLFLVLNIQAESSFFKVPNSW